MANSEDRARRWMESKHWGGWRVGMVNADGVVCVVEDDGIWKAEGHGPGALELQNHPPDLNHPGTRAFLLEDVRRAWGPGSYGDTCALHGGASGRRVLAKDRRHFKTTDRGTEAEALVGALEAAP